VSIDHRSRAILSKIYEQKKPLIKSLTCFYYPNITTSLSSNDIHIYRNDGKRPLIKYVSLLQKFCSDYGWAARFDSDYLFEGRLATPRLKSTLATDGSGHPGSERGSYQYKWWHVTDRTCKKGPLCANNWFPLEVSSL